MLLSNRYKTTFTNAIRALASKEELLARLFRIGTAKPISASIKRSERERVQRTPLRIFSFLSRTFSLSLFITPLLHRLASSHPSSRPSPPLPSLLWPSRSTSPIKRGARGLRSIFARSQLAIHHDGMRRVRRCDAT